MHSEEKQILREQIKKEYRARDLYLYVPHAVELFTHHPLFIQATSVLVYMPIRGIEIPFVDEVMRQYPEKMYFVPEVVGESEMLFVHGDTGTLYRAHSKTCVVVPALALDKEGNRLGKGGGYYDRFLSAHPLLRTKTIALVPSFAYVDTLPTEAHDVRVQHALCVLP